MLSLKRVLSAGLAVSCLPLLFIVLSFSFVAFSGCGNGNPVSLDPSEAPPNVLAVANDAVPGGEIKSVEMEEEDGQTIYEVEKEVGGVRYEIEVTAEGKVIEIEKGDDDDDDDDDDGDDD